jgi:WD40 repeat protein
MSATDDTTTSKVPSGLGAPGVEDDLLAGQARLDAFISYRRLPADTAFVDQLQEALSERGKQVWVDRSKIEPAADWSERIAHGIEAAKAFIFVITPESVASEQCRNELEAATQHHKLIIPVVFRNVDRGDLPENLSKPNWIFFTGDHDRGRALDEVVSALEEDLAWRDMHTRLTVRTNEWTNSRRDQSFLLRGSDLRSAEEWLGQGTAHKKTPPTGLQTEYILASRKAATRTQRTWRSALTIGIVVSLGLAGLAFVQRNQARHEAQVADSRALAAEATAALSSNPERSLSLALRSVRLDPSGPAVQALRLALAKARQRMVINSGMGSNTVAAWNPHLAQVAVTAPHHSVALWNAATGRLSQSLPEAHSGAVKQLLYDPSGSRLAAVSSAGFVSMWNISASGVASAIQTSRLNAAIQAALFSYARSGGALASGAWAGPQGDEFNVWGPGLSNVLIFAVDTGATSALFRQPYQYGGAQEVAPSPDGSRLLVDTELINFNSGTQIPLPQAEAPEGPACWFPDDSAVVTSTSVDAGGPEQFFKATSGTRFAHMQTPVGPTTAVGCSASSANEWAAAGDGSGNVILRLARGNVVPLYGHSDMITAIASSADGRYLATASNDGTARIWDATSGRAVGVLAGGEAPLTGVQFSSQAGLALTVDNRGFVRIWDTGLGLPLATYRGPQQGQIMTLGFTRGGRQVAGVMVQWRPGASSKIRAAYALTWNTSSARLLHSVALPGISPATFLCSAALRDIYGCRMPPPPNLTLTVPVPHPTGFRPNDVARLLALAVSPDGSYVAYARSRSVSLIGLSGGRPVSLPLTSTPTGLYFGASGHELVVMTQTAIYLWKPFSRQRPLVLPQPSAPIDAELNASANRLASANVAGTVSVWNTVSGKPLRSFRPPVTKSTSLRYFKPTPLRVAISNNGAVVASGNADGTVSLWDVATGRRVWIQHVSTTWPIVQLHPVGGGSRLLAVDWPQTGSGANAAGTAAVLDAAAGHIVARYNSPAPFTAPINPGAALSPDGSFLFAGALGLAPTAPGGIAAAYQVSSGETMENLQSSSQPTTSQYSQFPAQPWAPDGAELLIGNALYACNACGSLAELQAAAASKISWARPLSASSDHPPATNPYR